MKIDTIQRTLYIMTRKEQIRSVVLMIKSNGMCYDVTTEGSPCMYGRCVFNYECGTSKWRLEQSNKLFKELKITEAEAFEVLL